MTLVKFLTAIVSDEDWRTQFCANPRQAMRQADLGEDAMAALKSGDPRHVAFVICVKEAPKGLKFDPID